MKRRYQKIVEEAPSLAVDRGLRESLGRAALALLAKTRYRGAGTVEFLVNGEKEVFFLEVNTRLQVGDPGPGMGYNVDLVQAPFQPGEGPLPSLLPDSKVFTVLE